ncbi:hypothetical protein ERL59_06450 [Chengkuizengella sp. YPA3-1-1]|uniref:Uncharacterized protein n=2 Tax=Chengkuizengella marina TaxID=2507566 RepID=A0A6N9PYJ3_9BACL|nr:hypothetical protein [Chengkuizengella marina]
MLSLILTSCSADTTTEVSDIEEKYQEAVFSTSIEDWTKVELLINEIPDDYKDTKTIKLLLDSWNSYKEGDFESSLESLQKIDAQYDGDIKDDVSFFKEYIPEQIKEQKNIQESTLKLADETASLKKLLSSAKHDESIEYITDLYVSSKISFSEKEALLNYVRALNDFLNGYENSAFERLSNISPNYIGFYAEEVNKTLVTQGSKVRPPVVGMTKDEVLATIWGKPNKINTTTTTSGTDEQWVYDDNKYVYFENDVVVAIQEF